MALIEREAAKAKKVYCEERHEYVVPVAELDWLPTIATAPVVHARWVMRGGRFRCSACDAKALWRDTGGTGGWSHEYEQATTGICPNCGARMDGGDGHEAD